MPTGAKTGLVLTGGGARAAYQVGVLKAVRGHPRQPAREPVPDRLRHFGRRDQRGRARGLRRRLRRAVRQLLEVWEGLRCHARLPHRLPATSSAPAARWLARSDADLRAQPDLAARQRAAARHARRARWTSSASRRTSTSARSTRCRVTASGYTSGQSVSFFQGGSRARGLGAQAAHRRRDPAERRSAARLGRAAVHLPGGEVPPRVLRRRLDAPDRAGQPGAAPRRRPGARGRHRAADRRSRRACARTSTRRSRRSPATR